MNISTIFERRFIPQYLDLTANTRHLDRSIRPTATIDKFKDTKAKASIGNINLSRLWVSVDKLRFITSLESNFFICSDNYNKIGLELLEPLFRWLIYGCNF